MNRIVKLLTPFIALGCAFSSQAKVILPNIFSNNMVLQQLQSNPVWGKADQGEKITITIAGQSHQTTADKHGDWRITLNPIKVGGPYQLNVKGNNEITYTNVMSGEVWLCSGQSNMGWKVSGSNHSKIEIASANYPNLRLLQVPRVGIDTPQFNIDAKWTATTPETIPAFSATCYFYGRRIHQTLGVPVGLINSSWGGSPIESFISRDSLENDKQFDGMLKEWDERAKSFSSTQYAKDLAVYEAWKKSGSPGKRRFPPYNVPAGKKRPANIFNGVINPTVGYGIKGAIWCQGESNLGRAKQYQSLFPLLINSWRKQWNQGDFPFYWVQLADFNDAVTTPSKSSSWAELREAQTMALSLPNTGQAIVYDLGESKDIHPRNKQEAANRLVRHPLAKDYGYKMAADSPMFESIKITGNKALITFKNVTSKLYVFDTNTVKGFTIAGKDKVFVNANAKLVGKNKVEVSADAIKHPVAVRYGWENNPDINLYDRVGLAVTSFRTDK